jgi:hypothetical protein
VAVRFAKQNVSHAVVGDDLLSAPVLVQQSGEALVVGSSFVRNLPTVQQGGKSDLAVGILSNRDHHADHAVGVRPSDVSRDLNFAEHDRRLASADQRERQLPSRTICCVHSDPSKAWHAAILSDRGHLPRIVNIEPTLGGMSGSWAHDR